MTPTGSTELLRLQALQSYQVLDTAAELAYDNLTQLAARIFNVPIVLVSLIDQQRQWFKSAVGMPQSETPRDIAFCNQAIRFPEVMVVKDAACDSRFSSNPLVTGEPGIRFYAGAPLVNDQGHALGTLCIIDRKPRDLSELERQTLTVLSQQVMAQLELRKGHIDLMRTMQELQEEHEQLQKVKTQFEKSESRLSLVLKGANDGWWDWDLVTDARYYSPRGWSMLGYDQKGYSYSDALWEKLIHPDDAVRVDKTLSQAIRGEQEHYIVELRLRHNEGHYLDVLCRGFILRNDQGRALRLSGTNTDLTERKKAERSLFENQERYALLFDYSLDGILQTIPGGTILDANPAACVLLGRSKEELLQAERGQVLNLSDNRVTALIDQRDLHGQSRGSVTMLRANGDPFEVEMSTAIYQDHTGQRIGSVMFRDITEQQQMALRMRESLALLNNLAHHIPGVIYQFRQYPDGRSCFPYASEGIWGIYEVTAAEIHEDATPVFARLHPDDLNAVAASIGVSAATLQPWHDEYRVNLPAQGLRWLRGDAQPERLDDGSILWHGYISDITERKLAEDNTHRLAYFDALTGLPNRRLLMDRLQHALASAQRSGQFGALIFMDLDNFKHINDARGHAVGDILLHQVSQRLSHLLREEDTVARLGGDEFVILACDLGTDADTSARSAMAVAEKVREVLDSPYQIEGYTYRSTGSIGLTLFPKSGQQVDDLLREADTAMYRAKASGRNRIAFFESSMQLEVEERLALEQDLTEAVATDLLHLDIQTQFNALGVEVGGELLLRWKDPVRGFVSPAKFIPIAEESGLILKLGDWVIRQACLSLSQMQAAGVAMDISVNVSPRQFHKNDFVERVKALLQETGAPVQHLIFEVTEGLLIQNLDDAISRMTQLVDMGIRFSIDDFGTGYSSLAYLKKLPLYELKIDKSFVQDTPDDPSDTAIVQSILSVARHLKLRVVAEGVETRAQADFLIANQCDSLQGYLFARPKPLKDWLVQRLQK